MSPTERASPWSERHLVQAETGWSLLRISRAGTGVIRWPIDWFPAETVLDSLG
jgi:hypothetical protein